MEQQTTMENLNAEAGPTLLLLLTASSHFLVRQSGQGKSVFTFPDNDEM